MIVFDASTLVGVAILVSSDDDLLALHPWRGVRVMRPAEYLERAGKPD